MLLGFDFSIGVLSTVGLVFLIAGTAIFVIARLWPDAKSVIVAAGPIERTPLGPSGEFLARALALRLPLAPAAPRITWPAMLDDYTAEPNDDERHALIDGLAIVGAEWCAEILEQAYDEETGALRIHAIEALARCTGELVAPALERAYASPIVDERYAAIDGASRRGDVVLLARGLADSDGTVALAAAYGLHRAGEDARIDQELVERDDPRAAEIRRMLPILALTP